MSEPALTAISALGTAGGAAGHRFTATGLVLTELPPAPALAVRLLPWAKGAKTAAKGWLGVTVPGQGEGVGERPRLLWQGPDALLAIGDGLPDGPAPEGVFATPVGGGLLRLRLTGELAPDLLAAGCGLDLRGDAFPEGRVARTLLFQVPVTLDRNPAADGGLDILAPAPLGRYLWLALTDAARGLDA